MMFHNPKNTKQEIKLWAFYLLDIGIVVAMVVIANYISKVIPMSGKMEIFYYVISALFGVFLCLKTPSHPTERNASMILHLFRMDRNRYHPIDIKDLEEKRG